MGGRNGKFFSHCNTKTLRQIIDLSQSPLNYQLNKSNLLALKLGLISFISVAVCLIFISDIQNGKQVISISLISTCLIMLGYKAFK